MSASLSSSLGDFLFRVYPLHWSIRGRRCGRSLRRSKQRHFAPEADAEAGICSVLLPVLLQQICQYHNLRHLSFGHPVLPHPIHHHQLLKASQWGFFSCVYDDNEHNDADLFLPPAPLWLHPKAQTCGTKRDTQQQFKKVPHWLTRCKKVMMMVLLRVGINAFFLSWPEFVTTSYNSSLFVVSHCQRWPWKKGLVAQAVALIRGLSMGEMLEKADIGVAQRSIRFSTALLE